MKLLQGDLGFANEKFRVFTSSEGTSRIWYLSIVIRINAHEEATEDPKQCAKNMGIDSASSLCAKNMGIGSFRQDLCSKSLSLISEQDLCTSCLQNISCQELCNNRPLYKIAVQYKVCIGDIDKTSTAPQRKRFDTRKVRRSLRGKCQNEHHATTRGIRQATKWREGCKRYQNEHRYKVTRSLRKHMLDYHHCKHHNDNEHWKCEKDALPCFA